MTVSEAFHNYIVQQPRLTSARRTINCDRLKRTANGIQGCRGDLLIEDSYNSTDSRRLQNSRERIKLP